MYFDVLTEEGTRCYQGIHEFLGELQKAIDVAKRSGPVTIEWSREFIRVLNVKVFWFMNLGDTTQIIAGRIRDHSPEIKLVEITL